MVNDFSAAFTIHILSTGIHIKITYLCPFFQAQSPEILCRKGFLAGMKLWKN